jgi:uncharacterized protein YjlB
LEPSRVIPMTSPETFTLDENGRFPNTRLPVVVYRDVDAVSTPSDCTGLFARNGWLGAWVNGIFPFHRFHATAHEVLGIVDGSGSLVLGGPGGIRVEVGPGVVLVLPAGAAHSNAGPSNDFVLVGAYPNGMTWDLRQGNPDERNEVLAHIESVPLPDSDPVYGPGGPLTEIWRASLN